MESRTDPAPFEVDEPDIGFQAGFGFYLGLVVAGFAAIGGVVADLATATLLGLLPSTVTVVTLVGHVLAKRAHGLPERIGRSRRLRLACYAPPVAAVAPLSVAWVAPIAIGSRLPLVTILTVLLTGIAAFGVDRMSRTRYVEALAADEPATTWTWHRSGLDYNDRLFSASMVLVTIGGLVTAVVGRSVYGLFVAAYGFVVLLSMRFDWGEDWDSVDPSQRWNAPTVRAHEAGLVVDRSFAKTFVSWDDVDDVRLTDDELVFERRRFGRRSRWFDLRCDREAIDDPEAVYEAIETVRTPTAVRSR